MLNIWFFVVLGLSTSTISSRTKKMCHCSGTSRLKRICQVVLDRMFDVLCSLILGHPMHLIRCYDSLRPKTKIQDLNDHVMREVFEHLNVADLSVIADVCTNFKQNARAVYFVRFKTKVPSITVLSNDRVLWSENEIHIRQLPAILRNFGSSTNALEIDLDRSVRMHSQQILELINQHCRETLRYIWLWSFLFTDDFIPIMQSVFSRLQKLYLHECVWHSEFDVSGMLSTCSELKELEISRVRNSNNEDIDLQLRITIPKLKSFTITGCGVKKKSIIKFLRANRQLDELEILGCPKITSRVIQPIVQYVPRIKTIRFTSNVFTRDFFANVRNLQNLTALKSLKIDGFNRSISSIIREIAAARIPLEYLLLWMIDFDKELAVGIAELRKLKQLVFIGACNMKLDHIVEAITSLGELTALTFFDVETLSAINLAEIIRCAPKLCELSFRAQYEDEDSLLLDVDAYNEVLSAVRGREETCHLDLIITKYRHQTIDVPNELLRANEELLRIIVA